MQYWDVNYFPCFNGWYYYKVWLTTHWKIIYILWTGSSADENRSQWSSTEFLSPEDLVPLYGYMQDAIFSYSVSRGKNLDHNFLQSKFVKFCPWQVVIWGKPDVKSLLKTKSTSFWAQTTQVVLLKNQFLSFKGKGILKVRFPEVSSNCMRVFRCINSVLGF